MYSGQSSGRLDYDFTEELPPELPILLLQTVAKSCHKVLQSWGWIYGQSQGEWLRAAVQDASGKDTVLDLAKNVDWDGWRWVEVSLPAGKEPFTLKTIYVVETEPEKNTAGTVYLDELTALIAGKYDESLLPPAPIWIDTANQKGSGFTFGAVGTMPLTKDNHPDYDRTLALAQRILNKHNSGFNAVVGHPWADENVLKDQLNGLNNYEISGTGYSIISEKEATFIFLDATKAVCALPTTING